MTPIIFLCYFRLIFFLNCFILSFIYSLCFSVFFVCIASPLYTVCTLFSVLLSITGLYIPSFVVKSIDGMVHILDGNPEDVEHVVENRSILKKSQFVTALDLNKCLRQIKTPTSLHACAPFFWVTIKYKYHD